MQQPCDWGAVLAFLGVPKPGTARNEPSEADKLAADRAWAGRPMTADRVTNDCGLATAAAQLGAHQIGMGRLGGAARFFGMALAHIEALVGAGCDAVEGAESVPILSHQLTATCQAHGILDAAVTHAKQQLHRWESA